jgi:hypothetical protein
MFKKLLKISCKHATFLASKKEAGKISSFENIKLKLHYKICGGCHLFDKQTTLIGNNAKHTHIHTDATMRPEKKQQIKDIIKAAKIVFL